MHTLTYTGKELTIMTQHDDDGGKDSSTATSMDNEPAADVDDEPLSSAELEAFIRDGYILLKRAFDPAVAAACRDEIWRVMEEETRTRATPTRTVDGGGDEAVMTRPVSSTSSSLTSPIAAAAVAPPSTSSGSAISRHDPSTWPIKFPLARIYRPEDGPPWSNVFTPRLCKAVDQLCGGTGSWESFGCGWWMITFPSGKGEEEGREEGVEENYSSPSSSLTTKEIASSSSTSSSSFYHPHPWRLDGHWHIDGQTRHRCIHTQQVGLVPIFLFSDVKPGGGGTALCTGSHKYISRLLKEAGPEGMDAVEVIKKGQAWVEGGGEGGREGRVVETVGEAGDVMFTHPFLLHGRSANCAEVPKEEGREEGVRFMCHPSVSLTRVPWLGGREGGRDGEMSVVERAIVAGWEEEEGGREVFSHEDCLTAAARWEERKGRGRGHGVKRRTKGGAREEEEEEVEEVLPEGVDADVMAVMGMTGFGSAGGGNNKKRRQW